MRGKYVIAGIGNTPFGKLGLDTVTLNTLACQAALQDAGIEKGAVVGAAARDPPVLGSPTHTVVLQSGQPQKDRVGAQQERYYVLYVPAGITGSVTITVDPVQVTS